MANEQQPERGYELERVYIPDRQRCLDAVLAVLRAPRKAVAPELVPTAAVNAAERSGSARTKKAPVSSH